MTNDGLVGFKRVPGPDGETVVADLAEALPTPTDGGRTYAFQLRRGIRYSTGRPVRATDVRHGLERFYAVNAAYIIKYQPEPDLFGAIVGAPKCFASPRSCHLNRGIVVDDESGTITFHLRHPDPDFLAKLALPYAVAVPGDLPRHDSGLHPVPATGPYMITHYDIRHAVLERNPYFQEWSRDAQPDGYPDRIVWRAFEKPSQAVSAVEHGTADWLYFTIPDVSTQQIHDIETNYASQIHPSAYPAIDVLVFAPDSSLGRDPLARRAIAYAVDRARFGDRPACRRIPPNFPGYRPDCPYSLDPALALKLVHRSPSYGKPVAVYSWNGPTPGRYIVELLNTLGFRARLLPSDENGYPIGFPDVELYGWAMDYLGASSFIRSLGSAPLTASELNDAYRQQSESQYQGTRAWAAADRRVTEFAMVIPVAMGTSFGFTSKRVGNYQFAPVLGNSPIIDQMWVR
jgi:peptide/nickel transport system substrate-binding protein